MLTTEMIINRNLLLLSYDFNEEIDIHKWRK